MGRSIGIDLGTANTIVCVKGKGIVLREPSVVAIESRTGKVVAVGSDAKRMLGRTPGSITAMRPLKDGVIAEFDVAAAMLHQFFKKVSGNTMLTRPRVVICIPYGVTEVEKRAVEDATLEAGAQSVALIEEPIAAAIGTGLKIESPRGNMIIDIGGGTTEVAVISLGGIVLSNSLRVAGDELDEAIVNYMRRKFNILIGESTAERLKKEIGSIHPAADRGEREVRGRNLLSGLPMTVTINSANIREAISEEITHIVDALSATLESTPPELSGDIYDNGIMLAGGGALLGGLNILLSQLTGIRVIKPKRPLDAVALGIERVLESEDKFPGATQYRTR
ncbi:MAG: rod shape-determining protein [Firmicutes bacterium]|nr:rod shape-determining protein [Bacillota bacterium]MCD8003911.1 rod shape-determining protein [Clostridia bacterium]MCD8055372.1 rod shape-determining protein [Clostridiales bacterium]MCD7782915.1 rod shape-determining protein [Bacillota bacterium]MCD7787898.1 rod shape-determining protein [Bacillota bacterium]